MKWSINFYWQVINLCLKCIQTGFTYSASGSFTRNKQRIKKLCKQEMQIICTKMNWIKLVST